MMNSGSHELDPEACYRAVQSRDRRFEGRFVLAVTSTGIYCRPGCHPPLETCHRPPPFPGKACT